MKDLEVRHQSEVSKLTVEIRRLNELITSKEGEIEEVRSKYLGAQSALRELKQDGSKLNWYEEQMGLLNQEHLRLNQMIDSNANELDLARKKELQLSKQLNNEKDMACDNEHLRVLLQEKQQ
jgi:hypothetical protein